MQRSIVIPSFIHPRKLWSEQRETSRSWLALGLLLAAWNAVDDGSCASDEWPSALRGYACISVRAARRVVVNEPIVVMRATTEFR